jgi:hypothetical protein
LLPLVSPTLTIWIIFTFHFATYINKKSTIITS